MTDLVQKLVGEPNIMAMVNTLIASVNEAHHANSQEWRDASFESADRVYEKIKEAVTALYTRPAAAPAIDIKAAAGKLMGWPLPKDFSPDGGVQFTPPSFGWPTGTNLLNVQQAEQMLAYVLDGAAAAPAVPEGSAQEAMTSKWCWWFGDGGRFQIVDTESEAHGEAQSYIDDDAEPGEERAYSIARVQHPIDALGMDWLALHVAESIAENVCCWCDDNTGAEEPSIMLSPDDSKALGLMVATFLRQRVGVDWWTADQKTVTQHTYVAGGNDALAAAQAKGVQHG